MSSAGGEPPLIAALQGLHRHMTGLPDDDSLFAGLDPEQRRNAHSLGCRLQDRLVRVLARLVADMAADGADLVDEGGLPRSYSDGGSDA